MTVAEAEDTRKVELSDLSDLLNRSEGTISRAAHQKYYCNEYPVWKWAEWHPRGNQIRHYKVPLQVLRELAPEEEYLKYGIFTSDQDE